MLMVFYIMRVGRIVMDWREYLPPSDSLRQSTSINANESGISENIAEPSGCWTSGTSV